MHKLVGRFLQGVGLADVSLQRTRELLPSYLSGSSASFRLVRKTADSKTAIEFLSKLTFPASRHVVFGIGGITAMVNNSRNGSDYADHISHLPRHLNCRFARVVDSQSKIFTKGELRMVLGHEARIFDLHDAQGETIRSVVCMNDGGRWIFETSGDPHDVETGFPYEKKRKSDRFTSDHLRQLSHAYGLTIPRVKEFQTAGYYLLFEQEHGGHLRGCNITEADDPAYWNYTSGMSYVRHLETHASSVITLFERCLEWNPDYEPRVRNYLDAARKHVQNQQDH